MRTLSALALISVLASACATQSTPASAPAPAAAHAEAKPAAKAPQCWNGDESKFIDVGVKANVSGVNVECKLTGDGKAAQWMSSKH